jgi:hypothetical protein
MTSFNIKDFDHMEKHHRANFINSLSGFKSANLIGTKSLSDRKTLLWLVLCFMLVAIPPLLA